MTWLLLIQTADGYQPFAALINADACALMVGIIRNATGLAGVCVQVLPGVAS